MFGKGSFDHPITSPWSSLLTNSNPSTNTVSGLKFAWSHLQLNFQEVSSRKQALDASLLLNQDITRAGFGAGFGADSTVAPSVTNVITIKELERSWRDHLDQQIETSLDRGDCEKWSWDACTWGSLIFLHLPPDQFGYIEDPIFQVAWTTDLGQACPLLAPVVGRYFAKKGEVLDKYGTNLALAPLLGAGH